MAGGMSMGMGMGMSMGGMDMGMSGLSAQPSVHFGANQDDLYATVDLTVRVHAHACVDTLCGRGSRFVCAGGCACSCWWGWGRC